MPDIELPAGDAAQFLEFIVGLQHYCLEILEVREVRMLESVTPLAQSPRHVCGVMNLRGDIVPVIDLGVRFGVRDQCDAGPLDAANPAIVLIADIRGELTALRIDRILDVLDGDLAQMQPVPRAAADEGADYVQGMLTIDGRLVLRLELAKLVPRMDSVEELCDTQSNLAIA